MRRHRIRHAHRFAGPGFHQAREVRGRRLEGKTLEDLESTGARPGVLEGQAGLEGHALRDVVRHAAGHVESLPPAREREVDHCREHEQPEGRHLKSAQSRSERHDHGQAQEPGRRVEQSIRGPRLRARSLHLLDDGREDLVHVLALERQLGREGHPVAQARHGHGLDVGRVHVVPACHERGSSSATDHGEGAPGAGAEHETLARARRADELHGVARQGLLDADLGHPALELPDLLGARDLLDVVDDEPGAD